MNSNQIIIPLKLKRGDHIRVITPSRSMSIISQDVRDFAVEFFNKNEITISFGKNVEKSDMFNSSSIEDRINDLHDAFSDENVNAILTAIGGYNSNQLLDYIDYDLIKNNPKILCGYSDVTALANAITSKTGLVTYSGPHFSTFGMKKGIEYTINNFLNVFAQRKPFNLIPSKIWSDDLWFLDQENRNFEENEGYWVINKGYGYGKLHGGHLRCVAALQGTDYWFSLVDSVLFIEEDAETNPQVFDRLLQSLIQQKDFENVKAILIGKFQKATEMTKEKLIKIISEKKELSSIPIVANMNFGHTTPILTLPIGGVIEVDCTEECKIKLIEF